MEGISVWEVFPSHRNNREYSRGVLSCSYVHPKSPSSLGENGYMFMYGWVSLLCTWKIPMPCFRVFLYPPAFCFTIRNTPAVGSATPQPLQSGPEPDPQQLLLGVKDSFKMTIGAFLFYPCVLSRIFKSYNLSFVLFSVCILQRHQMQTAHMTSLKSLLLP